jgi:hypothetical protein
MKLFEFMPHKKAIPGSDFPFLKGVLEQGVAGVFVQADSANERARVIAELCDDGVRCQELGRASDELLICHVISYSRAERILCGLDKESI